MMRAVVALMFLGWSSVAFAQPTGGITPAPSPWRSAGGLLTQVPTTDQCLVGATTTQGAKFAVVGDVTDEVTERIIPVGSQTAALTQWRNSANNADVGSVSVTGAAAFDLLSTADKQAATGGNYVEIFDNGSTGALVGDTGTLRMGDDDNTAANRWCFYDGTTKVLCLPTANSTSTTSFLASAASGVPEFRVLVDADIPAVITLGDGAVAYTKAADSSTTAVATTAFVQQEINGAGGAGLACSSGSCATASGEQSFLASGALTCGANTNGKAQVHTTPLQYCDNAATPTLQYAAYGDVNGKATAGDSATAFFGGGTLETTYGGLGTDLSAVTGVCGLNAGAYVDLDTIAELNTALGSTQIREAFAHATDCPGNNAAACDAAAEAGNLCYDLDDGKIWVCDGTGTPAWEQPSALASIADNSITEAKLNSASVPTDGLCVKIATDTTAFAYSSCVAGIVDNDVPDTITITTGLTPVAEAADTTMSVLLSGETATANQAKTSTGLTYDASTSLLTAKVALNTASTAVLQAADTNTTAVATTSFVQQEIQDAGDDGRSLTGAATGVINADAELYTDTKCVTLETPATADDWMVWRPTFAVTVTRIFCISENATSLTVNVKECDGDGNNCGSGSTRLDESIVCAVTATQDDGTLGNPEIAANDVIRIDPTALSGTPGHTMVCITFTKDD